MMMRERERNFFFGLEERKNLNIALKKVISHHSDSDI